MYILFNTGFYRFYSLGTELKDYKYNEFDFAHSVALCLFEIASVTFEPEVIQENKVNPNL